MLILMEIALSFDNAVLNAKVLQTMSPVWQRRFIMWGIPIAVFGMRLVFPIVIVAIAAQLPVMKVLDIAINNPAQYASHLNAAHIPIAAFGGIFLLMVFLNFIFDHTREIFWLGKIEEKLSIIGKIDVATIAITMITILGISHLLAWQYKADFITYGLIGILTYVVIEAAMEFCNADSAAITKNGFAGFMYLEVLDASCSLDGVIGAFVLTDSIILIMIGLGIGAFAVRSLTIYLVKGGVLKQYLYLEHGAHYGIGALAVIMLTSVFFHVSEVITGMIGMGFIALSIWSSKRRSRKELLE